MRVSRLSSVVLLVCVLGCEGSDGPAEVEGVLPSEIVISEVLPPPIQGGTLEVEGDEAFVSDPGRDRVWVIDLNKREVASEVQLESGTEPGRIAVLDQGVAVASRGLGHVALLNAGPDGQWSEVRRAKLCGHMEGVAYDAATSALWVTCLSGRTLQLAIDDLSVQQEVDLGPDIRDIVIADDLVYVSRFRAAEVIVLNRQLEQQDVLTPQTRSKTVPAVAWRMRAHPRGGIILAHQSGSVGSPESPLHLNFPTVYGTDSECSVAVVASTVSHLRVGQAPRGGRALGNAVLPVDVAFDNSDVLSPKLVLAFAGNSNLRQSREPAVVHDEEGRILGNAQNKNALECNLTGLEFRDRRSIVSVAMSEEHGIVYQSRDPWLVGVGGVEIPLPAENLRDTGFTLFHTDAGKGIACASCHPMGRDDGLTWHFAGEIFEGPRRTPYIRGGLSMTEPFHWSGDVDDFQVLLDEIFARRMGGANLDARYAAALGSYFDRMENLKSPFAQDTEQVNRGKEIFFRTETLCSTCHVAPLLTDNKSYDVRGLDEALQVPRLHGLWIRAPYMHDGCAETLYQRFTDQACGGVDHGGVSSLAPEEIDDLVAYLKTL